MKRRQVVFAALTLSLAVVSSPNAAEVRARVSMVGGTVDPVGGDQALVLDDITFVCVIAGAGRPEP